MPCLPACIARPPFTSDIRGMRVFKTEKLREKIDFFNFVIFVIIAEVPSTHIRSLGPSRRVVFKKFQINERTRHGFSRKHYKRCPFSAPPHFVTILHYPAILVSFEIVILQLFFRLKMSLMCCISADKSENKEIKEGMRAHHWLLVIMWQNGGFHWPARRMRSSATRMSWRRSHMSQFWVG